MDVLTDVLNALELKGQVTARRALVPPWRYKFAASQDMIFHLLSSGGGYLSFEGDPTPPMRIEGGGVLLFPFGHAHSICDELTSPLTGVSHIAYSAQSELRAFPDIDEGSKMVVLCGAFRLEHSKAFPLLHSLPKVIHIPTEQGHIAPGFTEIVHLIAREAAAPRLGTEVMLRRLTELLFIQIIRIWAEQQAGASTGWLAALHDHSISTALGLIHQSPERGWKVEELAEAVALSRAVFSARFTRLVGEPPITYLTRWRMHRATRLLKNNVEMEKIAELVGYESEVAFRKAFKREVGMPPAKYQKLGEPVSMM
ncbi:AraC family transcriptional regulator [Dictyobacter kobayashii]|uniref:AraC family transcriptional regulator n=1 Tax=Dictyobacter kobayashii TaxID=2014872 RepID=A0A402AST3_9CHLR|nr:AraC family transcriptional regulator [Dictyobacter kobayashii]GCE22103.1 AraC family transcriptional regulator [Dictyobacter kobayashii]